MPADLSFDAGFYSPGERHPIHEHDSLHMSLVLDGHVRESVGCSTEYAGALSVVVKDSGVRHADEFGRRGARLARLGLMSGTVAELIDNPARSASWRWTHDPRIANPFLRLVDRGLKGAGSFAADDPDVLDLLAAFTARPVSEARGTPPAWLVHTITEVRESWHPELSVGDVARRAGVHPVYLARSMRRWFGTGVSEELRRLRLQSAGNAIAMGNSTISRVAHSQGYSDEPHLCREFQRALGMTPGRYRTLLKRLDRTGWGYQQIAKERFRGFKS